MADSVRSGLLFGLFFCPLLVGAQTNHPPQSYPANRYLLVVETSRTMLNRSGAVVRTVQQSLGSAIARQARPGDTLGVWTFDDELHTRLIPLQQWAPANQNTITKRIEGVVKAQKFDKKANFDRLLPALQHVVKVSPFLTVILVCSGDDQIHGTPFDERINNFFKSWHQQQVDARAPFVIALRAQAGGFVDCSMDSAPWPLQLPALPKELFVAAPAPVPRTKPAPAKPAPARVPPLIVIGKKHETAPPPTNAGAVAPTSPAALKTTTNPAPGSLEIQEVTSQPELRTESEPVADQATAIHHSGLAPSPSEEHPAGPPGPETEKAGSQANLTITERQSAPADKTVAPIQRNVSDASAPPTASKTKPALASVAAIASTRRPADLWLISGTVLGLIGAALAAVWVWGRRTRAPAEASLITESFDRNKR